MKVEIIQAPTDQDWLRVRNNALFTQRKSSNKVPSSELKKKFLIAEHSPIKDIYVTWAWYDIPYYIAMHIRTHWLGIIPFISSQRNDIQKDYDRTKAPQDAPVNYRASANMLEILHISRARLCLNASPETTKTWKLFLARLYNYESELVQLCVKPCIYRNGICPEVFKPCGYNETNHYQIVQKGYNKYIGFTKEDDLT